MSATASNGIAAGAPPSKRRNETLDQLARHERPRRIVDEDVVRLVRRQRFQPAPHGFLPRRAAGHEWQMREAVERLGRTRFLSRTDHHLE